jgi:hypothetical protein
VGQAVGVLGLTADSTRRGIMKIDSMASDLKRWMEIVIVATTSYSSLGIVLHEIKIDLRLNPLQHKFKDLHK